MINATLDFISLARYIIDGNNYDMTNWPRNTEQPIVTENVVT